MSAKATQLNAAVCAGIAILIYLHTTVSAGAINPLNWPGCYWKNYLLHTSALCVAHLFLFYLGYFAGRYLGKD